MDRILNQKPFPAGRGQMIEEIVKHLLMQQSGFEIFFNGTNGPILNNIFLKFEEETNKVRYWGLVKFECSYAAELTEYGKGDFKPILEISFRNVNGEHKGTLRGLLPSDDYNKNVLKPGIVEIENDFYTPCYIRFKNENLKTPGELLEFAVASYYILYKSQIAKR